MVATQQAFSETTKDGNYLITNLKPGTYNLAVEADGFKRSVQEGIRLATGERIRVATVLDPGVVSELVPSSQQSTAQFFNTAAFQAGPQFTIGNSSRNPVRGPGYRNADIAVIKRVAFGETRNVEFRTEFFNLTNTPPLGAPNVVVGSPDFGSITSAGDPRVIQFGLKLNY